MRPVTRNQLIEELRRLRDEVGETPSARDMRYHGEYTVNTYSHRFGSWTEAVREAGFTPRSVAVSSDELIAELKRLAEELGRPPSATDMKNSGSYSINAYRNHFGSWNDAIEAAGFDPTPEGGEQLQYNDLIEELLRLAEQLDRPPTTNDMREHGEYSVDPYYKRFESWEAALNAAEIPEAIEM